MANNGKKSYFEYFQGKGSWIRANVPDPKYKKWSMDMYPNDKSLDKFRALQEQGVLTHLRKNDLNEYYFKLSRPSSKIIKGEIVAFTAPKLMDKDGNILENNLKIGNGSDCTAKVQVYYYPTPSGGQGIAIRWEGLKIDNLVPFKIEDFPLEEQVQISGLKEQPAEQLW